MQSNGFHYVVIFACEGGYSHVWFLYSLQSVDQVSSVIGTLTMALL